MGLDFIVFRVGGVALEKRCSRQWPRILAAARCRYEMHATARAMGRLTKIIEPLVERRSFEDYRTTREVEIFGYETETKSASIDDVKIVVLLNKDSTFTTTQPHTIHTPVSRMWR